MISKVPVAGLRPLNNSVPLNCVNVYIYVRYFATDSTLSEANSSLGYLLICVLIFYWCLVNY